MFKAIPVQGVMRFRKDKEGGGFPQAESFREYCENGGGDGGDQGKLAKHLCLNSGKCSDKKEQEHQRFSLCNCMSPFRAEAVERHQEGSKDLESALIALKILEALAKRPLNLGAPYRRGFH